MTINSLSTYDELDGSCVEKNFLNHNDLDFISRDFCARQFKAR